MHVFVFLFLGGGGRECVHAKSLQSCPSPYSPMDCRPPGSSVHGILQARILEWVAMPTSRGSSQLRDQIRISYISCIRTGSLPLVPIGKPFCWGEQYITNLFFWNSGITHIQHYISFQYNIIIWYLHTLGNDHNKSSYHFLAHIITEFFSCNENF